MKKRVLRALSQESTWRGLIAIAMGLGIKLEPQLWDAILTVGLSLIGGINVVKDD